jgi:hypothetical protein
MSSKKSSAPNRTQPDGTRSESFAEGRALTATDEVFALRDALDLVLAARDPGRAGHASRVLGTSAATVRAVARVVRRAHTALHEHASPSETVQRRCAQVLLRMLPEPVSERLILADALAQVRMLAREHDPARAISEATAALLGWTEVASRVVARVVDVVDSPSEP